MRTGGLSGLLFFTALSIGSAASVAAQAPEPATRQAAIEQEQAAKVKELHAYVPGKAERVANRIDELMAGGIPRWHPFFDKAYSGGGFTLGLGYSKPVSAYNFVDVRGSYTIKGYKLIEAEFKAPRIFQRRGKLSLLGGWREATQVGFYGLGMDNSKDDRTNYDFEQPYGSATLELWPARKYLMFRGGAELSEWSLHPGKGRAWPSVETRYTPATLPGLGARARYLHTEARSGSTGARRLDTRGAADSTAQPCTTTPTMTTSSGSGRSSTRRSSTFPYCGRRGSSRCAARSVPRSTRTIR
jgi:hypothetical protein